MSDWKPEVGTTCQVQAPADKYEDCEILKNLGDEMAYYVPSLNLVGISHVDGFRPIITEAEKRRDEQIKAIKDALVAYYGDGSGATHLYNANCRIISPGDGIVNPLTDEQKDNLRRHFKFAVDEECLLIIIDAVQRELGVID